MKKWFLSVALVGLLAACGEEEATGPAIEKIEPNADVQSVIDLTEDDTYASLIYSEQNDNFLLLNARGDVTVTTEASDDVLTLHITEENSGETTEDEVYTFKLDKPYETIKMLLNEKEIQFDIWYE